MDAQLPSAAPPSDESVSHEKRSSYKQGYAYSWKRIANSFVRPDAIEKLPPPRWEDIEWKNGYLAAEEEIGAVWNQGRDYCQSIIADEERLVSDALDDDNPYHGTSLRWGMWRRGFQYTLVNRAEQQRNNGDEDGDGRY